MEIDGAPYPCGICGEVRTEGLHRHFAVPGDATSFVCAACSREEVAPQFQRALEHEHHYPPRWGGTTINVDAFADVLGPDFVARYHVREIEYATPVNDRVYCPFQFIQMNTEHPNYNPSEPVEHFTITERCNEFLGRLGRGARWCHTCEHFICTNCEAVVASGIPHQCPGAPPADPTEASAFQGLGQAIEWQECPYCDRRVEQAGGCNEMICSCGEHFCFICGSGVAVDERPTHWTRGGCPRYHNPHTDEIDEMEDYDLDEEEGLNEAIADHVHDQFLEALVDDMVNNPWPPTPHGSDDDGDDGGVGGDEAHQPPRPMIPAASTPGSDNDFLGAAQAADAEDARRPLTPLLRRAFDAVHNNPVFHANPLHTPANVIYTQGLRRDRMMVQDAIHELRQAYLGRYQAHFTHVPGDVLTVVNQMDITHALNFTLALTQLIGTLLITVEDPNQNLPDLVGAIRVAHTELERWGRETIAALIGPEIEDIANARGGRQAFTLIEMLQELHAQQEAEVTPAQTPQAGPAPRDRDHDHGEPGATPTDVPAPHMFHNP